MDIVRVLLLWPAGDEATAGEYGCVVRPLAGPVEYRARSGQRGTRELEIGDPQACVGTTRSASRSRNDPPSLSLFISVLPPCHDTVRCVSYRHAR